MEKKVTVTGSVSPFTSKANTRSESTAPVESRIVSPTTTDGDGRMIAEYDATPPGGEPTSRQATPIMAATIDTSERSRLIEDGLRAVPRAPRTPSPQDRREHARRLAALRQTLRSTRPCAEWRRRTRAPSAAESERTWQRAPMPDSALRTS